MFKYQESIDIQCPVENVFEYIIDATTFHVWVETTVDAWQVSEGPVALGTRYSEIVTPKFSRAEGNVEVNWEVAEFEENRLISFENHSSFGYQKQSFTLTPTKEGTRLLVSGIHRFADRRRFIQPVMGFFIKRERRKHLAALKQILESRQAQS